MVPVDDRGKSFTSSVWDSDWFGLGVQVWEFGIDTIELGLTTIVGKMTRDQNMSPMELEVNSENIVGKSQVPGGETQRP